MLETPVMKHILLTTIAAVLLVEFFFGKLDANHFLKPRMR
jgi:hypothetical protein